MLAPDRWLKRGWRAFVMNAGAFIGATLILIVGAGLSLMLLFVPLAMGLLEMALRARRGEEVGAWDVTRGFRFFGPGLLLWLAGIAAALTANALEHVPLIGAFAGLIIGPMVALFGNLAVLCIMDQGVGVREALARVLLVVEQNWLGFWATSLLFTLLAQAGTLFFCFGVIVTVPWIACAWASAYQELFDRP